MLWYRTSQNGRTDDGCRFGWERSMTIYDYFGLRTVFPAGRLCESGICHTTSGEQATTCESHKNSSPAGIGYRLRPSANTI